MVSGASNLNDYVGRQVHETDHARLVDFGDGEETWLPKSQIERGRDLGDGNYEWAVPEWLAIEKGLE